jgi:Lhr-like helicase
MKKVKVSVLCFCILCIYTLSSFAAVKTAQKPIIKKQKNTLISVLIRDLSNEENLNRDNNTKKKEKAHCSTKNSSMSKNQRRTSEKKLAHKKLKYKNTLKRFGFCIYEFY